MLDSIKKKDTISVLTKLMGRGLPKKDGTEEGEKGEGGEDDQNMNSLFPPAADNLGDTNSIIPNVTYKKKKKPMFSGKEGVSGAVPGDDDLT